MEPKAKITAGVGMAWGAIQVISTGRSTKAFTSFRAQATSSSTPVKGGNKSCGTYF